TTAGLTPTWRHLVDLRLSNRLGASMQLELSNHNSGSQPVAVNQALHIYFAVCDVRQVQVEGLKDVPYLDTLDQWRTKQDTTALRFQGETDPVYQQVPAALAILDPAWQRRIQIRATNSTSAVVWNHWVEQSLRLS